jgi:hypothetical protein
MSGGRKVEVVLAEPNDWRALREASAFYAARSSEARHRAEDGLADALAGAARFLLIAADEEAAAAAHFRARRDEGLRAFKERSR